MLEHYEEVTVAAAAADVELLKKDFTVERFKESAALALNAYQPTLVNNDRQTALNTIFEIGKIVFRDGSSELKANCVDMFVRKITELNETEDYSLANPLVSWVHLIKQKPQ